jgi:hypothetical protein
MPSAQDLQTPLRLKAAPGGKMEWDDDDREFEVEDAVCIPGTISTFARAKIVQQFFSWGLCVTRGRELDGVTASHRDRKIFHQALNNRNAFADSGRAFGLAASNYRARPN